MNEYLTPGEHIVTYGEIMSDLSTQQLELYTFAGGVALAYVVFNIYVLPTEWFKNWEHWEACEGFLQGLTCVASLYILITCLSALY